MKENVLNVQKEIKRSLSTYPLQKDIYCIGDSEQT